MNFSKNSPTADVTEQTGPEYRPISLNCLTDCLLCSVIVHNTMDLLTLC